MRPAYRIPLVAALLLAALVCYLLSFQLDAGILFSLGALLEITGWILSKKRRNRIAEASI